MIEQSDRFIDRLDGRHVGQWRRPPHHHHRQSERARRRDLAIGGAAAAVLGQHDVDAVLGEQRAVVLLAERAAGANVIGVRHCERRVDRIDAAHQVTVLRRLRKPRNLLAAEREKDTARTGAERFDGLADTIDFDPAIALDLRPGRALQCDQRDAGGLCRPRGVGGHHLGIGVGRVDQDTNAFGLEISGKALGAAKAADSHRHGQRCGDRGAAGQRKPHIEFRAIGKAFGDPPRVSRAAENEDVGHGAR